MENSSETVNRSESSNFPPPPSRPAANGESGAPADPFRIDDLEKSLSSVEKSMDAPNPSMMIPDAPSITINFCWTMLRHIIAEHLCWEMFSHGLATHSVPDLPKHLFVKLVPKPELKHLCMTMDGRELAKLLKCRVSELPNIRERIHSLADVPEFRTQLQAALKLAPKPADLVYQCSNYVKDGQTYVLMMELFAQMTGDEEFEVEIAASTKQAALASARRWRNMYQASGGCDEDHRIQARAFLFFIVGFGISSVFSMDYIMNLIILSYPSQISDTLRNSKVLVPMIPDMIMKMLQHKLYGEAIDVAFSFGIEDMFPYKPIISSLKEDFEKLKEDFEKTSMGLKEMEKACIDLSKKYITLIEALSDHNICIDDSFHQTVHGIQTSIKEAYLKSKSNDDSVDDGRRDEMEMEMEHPLARRLTGDQLLRKRSGREPIICNLI